MTRHPARRATTWTTTSTCSSTSSTAASRSVEPSETSSKGTKDMSQNAVQSAESTSSIEENTIQPVPLDQRHGRNRDMFTIWFGTNIMILAIVTGGLATTLFGQPAWSAALGIVVGNLFGAIFM